MALPVTLLPIHLKYGLRLKGNSDSSISLKDENGNTLAEFSKWVSPLTVQEIANTFVETLDRFGVAGGKR